MKWKRSGVKEWLWVSEQLDQPVELCEGRSDETEFIQAAHAFPISFCFFLPRRRHHGVRNIQETHA